MGHSAYLEWMLEKSPGPALLLLSVIGVIHIIHKRQASGYVIICYSFVYLALFSTFQTVFHRYLTPFQPCLAIFVGIGAISLMELEIIKKWGKAVLTAVFIFAILWNVKVSVVQNQFNRMPDSRTLAGEWIVANLPENIPIAIEDNLYNPPIPIHPLILNRVAMSFKDPFERTIWTLRAKGNSRSGKRVFPVFNLNADIRNYDFDDLVKKKAGYVVLSSYSARQIRGLPRVRKFLESLHRESTLIKSFAVEKKRPGPKIDIYRLNTM